MDGGLDIMKYHHQWYHCQTFDKLLPDMSGLFLSNRTQPYDQPLYQQKEKTEPNLGDNDDAIPVNDVEIPPMTIVRMMIIQKITMVRPRVRKRKKTPVLT